MDSLILLGLATIGTAALAATLLCALLRRLFPHWKQWLIISSSAALLPGLLAAFSVRLFIQGWARAREGGGIDPGQLDMFFGKLLLSVALLAFMAGLASAKCLLLYRSKQ